MALRHIGELPEDCGWGDVAHAIAAAAPDMIRVTEVDDDPAAVEPVGIPGAGTAEDYEVVVPPGTDGWCLCAAPPRFVRRRNRSSDPHACATPSPAERGCGTRAGKVG